MSEKPWLTDPKYGGMSERSARLSYEAWVRGGKRVLPVKAPPASESEITRQKAIVDDLMADYERSIIAYIEWMRDWKAKRPRGFRAKRQGKGAA